MGFFSRRDRIVDLTEEQNYERKRSKDALKSKSTEPISTSSQEGSSGGFFNFFGDTNTSRSPDVSNTPSSGFNSSDNPDSNESLDAYEKRRRLAKRLKDMTDRIEDLSNQIYQLQQRVEVLEKKTNVGRYE